MVGMADVRLFSTAIALIVSSCRAEPAPALEASDVGVDDTMSSSTDEGLLDLGSTLPEGCGDGVVEPRQYCYEAIELPGLDYLNAALAVDLDEDGRDELLALDSFGRNLVQYVYEDDRFTELNRVELSAVHQWTTDFDRDGDGRRDVLVQIGTLGTPDLIWFPNDGGIIGEWIIEPLLEDVADEQGLYVLGVGVPGAIDLNGDAYPEFVSSLYFYGTYQGVPIDTQIWRARVFRRGSMGFEMDGPAEDGWPIPGCGWFSHHARADFDEDGTVDLVVLDAGTACDPYPYDYDPEWYRFLVFRVDPTTEMLELKHTVPVGAKPYSQGFDVNHLIHARDVDQDGHADIVINTMDGAVLHRGFGDGTFADPVFMPDTPYLFAQLDGDPELEMVLNPADGEGIYIADGPTGDAYRTLIYSTSELSAFVRGHADVNNDGIADVAISRSSSVARLPPVVLLSRP